MGGDGGLQCFEGAGTAGARSPQCPESEVSLPAGQRAGEQRPLGLVIFRGDRREAQHAARRERRAHRRGPVHAEQQRDCPESMRDVVALHVDDWNVLFDEKDPAAKRPVIVRLHPPRVEFKVDAQHRQVLGVIPVAN